MKIQSLLQTWFQQIRNVAIDFVQRRDSLQMKLKKHKIYNLRETHYRQFRSSRTHSAAPVLYLFYNQFIGLFC